MRPATIADAADIAALWDIGLTPDQVIQAMHDATFYVAPHGFSCWADGVLVAIVAADSATYRDLLQPVGDSLLAHVAADQLDWLLELPVAITPIGFTPLQPDEPVENRVPIIYEVTADGPTLRASL